MAARKQGKTNFAVACNLLSQCVKEKRSIANLGLGFDTRPQGDDKGENLLCVLRLAPNLRFRASAP